MMEGPKHKIKTAGIAPEKLIKANMQAMLRKSTNTQISKTDYD